MVSTTEGQFEHIAPLAVMRFLDGDMTEAEGAAVEQHLSSCDACHALFLQTQNQLSQLSGVSDIDGAGCEERRLDATMQLEAKLSKLAIEGSRPSRFRAAGGRWFAYAGCAAAILIVAISVWTSRPERVTPQVVAAKATTAGNTGDRIFAALERKGATGQSGDRIFQGEFAPDRIFSSTSGG